MLTKCNWLLLGFLVVWAGFAKADTAVQTCEASRGAAQTYQQCEAAARATMEGCYANCGADTNGVLPCQQACYAANGRCKASCETGICASLPVSAQPACIAGCEVTYCQNALNACIVGCNVQNPGQNVCIGSCNAQYARAMAGCMDPTGALGECYNDAKEEIKDVVGIVEEVKGVVAPPSKKGGGTGGSGGPGTPTPAPTSPPGAPKPPKK